MHDLQGRNGLNLDEEGSAADPGDADDTHVDDEDYRTAQPFKWGFQCDYDTGIMVSSVEVYCSKQRGKERSSTWTLNP